MADCFRRVRCGKNVHVYQYDEINFTRKIRFAADGQSFKTWGAWLEDELCIGVPPLIHRVSCLLASLSRSLFCHLVSVSDIYGRQRSVGMFLTRMPVCLQASCLHVCMHVCQQVFPSASLCAAHAILSENLWSAYLFVCKYLVLVLVWPQVSCPHASLSANCCMCLRVGLWAWFVPICRQAFLPACRSVCRFLCLRASLSTSLSLLLSAGVHVCS